MAVYDVYHRRMPNPDGSAASEVLTYDLPSTLRVQLRRTFIAAIGPFVRYTGYGVAPPNNNNAWEFIAEALRQEFGVDRLAGFLERNACAEICEFLDSASTDHCLTVVEFCCRYVDTATRRLPEYKRSNFGAKQSPDSALEEVNARFAQAGVGYRYEGRQIVRIDSELMHSEVVTPALVLLSDPRFKGADEEFRKAHTKHREQDDKAAVTEANNAFESTMKSICAIHNWTVSARPTTSELVKVLRDNGLFPTYLEKSFEHLQALLKAGLPEVRNNAGGHGQGPEPRRTPTYVGAYALHLAAANIVYLCEASKAREQADAAQQDKPQASIPKPSRPTPKPAEK